MQKERREELARHAARGAIILLVSARSPEQLSMSAGMLLRHGPHNLQTHVKLSSPDRELLRQQKR